MRLICDLGAERSMQLAHAVLVYADQNHGRAVATVHEPQPGPSGGVVLGPGRGISRAFVKALAEELGAAQPIEVLPERVLVRTPDVLVWWRPAGLKPMFFAPADTPEQAPLKAISGKLMPHPALVFRATAKQLWVRALRESRRPEASTRLAMAPYYNVSRVGSLCTNTMRIPATFGIDAIAEWERAFFESEFTHQIPGVSRLVSDARGYVKLWVHLANQVAGRRKSEAVAFPVSALVGVRDNETLELFARSDADEGQH